MTGNNRWFSTDPAQRASGGPLDRPRLWERAVSASRDGLIITGPLEDDCPIVYVNPAFELLYGYTADEVVGHNCRFLQGGERDQPPLDGLRDALGEGQEWTGVLRNYHKDGSLVWNELSISPVRDGPGHVTHFIGVQNDITARVRAEEESRLSEERLRAVLVQYGSDMITVLEPDGTPRYESPAVERTLGYRHMEVVGEDLFEFVHPEDVERLAEVSAATLRTPGESPPVEFRIRHADGSWRHFEAIGNNLTGNPEVRGVIVVTRDITQRKEDERALRESEERYRAVVERTSEGVFLSDLDTRRILETNAAFQEMLGYTAGELREMTVYDFVDHDRESVDRNIRRILEERNCSLGERQYRCRDGGIVDVETSVITIPYGHREVSCSVVRDIGGRKRAERALRESEKRSRQLFEQSVDALILHDERGSILAVNSEACRSLGYTREEMLSLYIQDLTDDLLTEEEKLARERDGGTLWQRVVAGDPEAANITHMGRHKRKDGTTFPIEVRVGGVDYGGRRRILASVRDITERKALEAELEYRAYYDSLTGLPNRSLFMERLGEALGRAGRRKSEVAVLFMDLDNFKVINDSLGHSTGDQLLSAVSRRLEACLCSGDLVARFGGDEFTILLEETGRARHATRVAERIAEKLQAPFVLAGQEVFVKISIGIAFGAADMGGPDRLLRDADTTMYRAKRNGRARYEVYDASLSASSLERLKLGSELQRAVERGELVVHYQPKVDLTTGEVASFEALLRWKHPERGLMLPGEFIHLAEETGLIVPIGQKVLRQACGQASLLEEEYGRPFAMSVNLSVRQMGHPALARDVEQTLRETGLDPRHLTLEVTESVVLEYEESNFARLRGIRALGVSISLDDFGTGYSSLSYLKHLPVDELKIDKSFVDGLGASREDAVLVSTMVGLSNELGLRVVAEGVETAGAAARLREMDCALAQGFYFSPPVPAGELPPLLEGGGPSG